MKTEALCFSVAGAIACTVASPVSARDSDPVRLEPKSGWAIDYSQWSCKLKRDYSAISDDGEPRDAAMVLDLDALATTASLRIVIQGKKGKATNGTGEFSIDGMQVDDEIRFDIFSTSGYRVRELFIDLNKVDIAATQDRFAFDLGQRGTLDVQVPEFAAAWDALQTCMSDLYQDFGIDQQSQSKMVKPPELDPFIALDFPKFSEPLQLAILYWTDETGKVDECRLIRPSGIESFDRRICDDLKAANQFEPARDAQGKPIRVAQFENMTVHRIVR